MFSDTLTVTINAVAKNLVRINQDRYSSEYYLREATGEFTLRIRNTSYKDKTRGTDVDRHNIELIHKVYPVAPALVGVQRKSYVVFENDRGDTIVDPVKTTLGLLAFNTEANLTKMANRES